MRILTIHGPNLNLLGTRDPAVYGTTTIDEINRELTHRAKARGASLDATQSNLEGEIVEAIQGAHGQYAALLLNPGGYSHTSVAIRDALDACGIPTVECHLSNIHAREEFRHTSLTAAKSIGLISGFGARSYYLGLDAALAHVETLRSDEFRQKR
ncbi:MAG: type II 3-dehydroquinate dehydratase [Myxococcales bacterium]|nr:type II 3-dehydroquinate dehydratase [Myxococcales bacterium]